MIKSLSLALLCLACFSIHAQNLQSDKNVEDTYFLFLDNRQINDRILTNDTVQSIPLSTIFAPYIGHQLSPVSDPFLDHPVLADQMFKSFVLYDLFFFKPQNESAPLSHWPDKDYNNDGNSNPSELSEYLEEIFGPGKTRKVNYDQLITPVSEGTSGHSGDLKSFMNNFSTEYNGFNLLSSYQAKDDVLFIGPARYDGASIRSIPANENEVYSIFALFSTLEACTGNCIQIGLEFFDTNGEEISSPNCVIYNMPGYKNYSNQGGGNFTYNAGTGSYNTPGLTPAIEGTWRDKSKTFKCPAGTAFMDIHIFANGQSGNWTTPARIDEFQLIKHAFTEDNYDDYNFPLTKLSLLPGRISSVAGVLPDSINFGSVPGINSAFEPSLNDSVQFPWQAAKLERRHQVFADRTPIATALAQAMSMGADYDPIQLFLVLPRLDFSYTHTTSELWTYFDKIVSAHSAWSSSGITNANDIQIAGLYVTDENQNDLSVTELQFIKASLDQWNTLNSKSWLLYASPYANLCTNGIYSSDLDYLDYKSQADSSWSAELDGVWQQPNVFAKPQASNNNKVTDQELLKAFNQYLIEHPGIGGNIELDYYNHNANPSANANIDPQPYARSIDYFSYGKKYGFVNNYKAFIDNAGMYYQLANLADTATGHLGNMRTAYHQTYNYLKAGNSGLITNGRFEVTNSTDDPYAWISSGATIQMHSGNQKGNVLYGNQYMAMDNTDALTSRALQINDGSYELRFLAKSPSGLGSLKAVWGSNYEVVQLTDEWTHYSIDLAGIQLGNQLRFFSSQDTELDAVEVHRGQSFVNHQWNEEFPLIIEANTDSSYFGAFSKKHSLDPSPSVLTINFEMRSKKTTGCNANLEVHVDFKDENDSTLSTTLNSISSANFAVAQSNLASQVDSGNYAILEYVPYGSPNGNACGAGSESGLDKSESRWVHNSVGFNVPFGASSYQIKFRSPIDEFYVLMEDDSAPLDSSEYDLMKSSQSNNDHFSPIYFRDGDQNKKQTSHSNASKTSQSNELVITLYPNPANTSITIGSQEKPGAVDVQLYNAEGKLITSTQISDQERFKTIDISDLSEGVYTAVVFSGDSLVKKSFVVRN